MIGLIDPAILLPRTGIGQEETFIKEVDEIIRACRRHAIQLLPFEEYWPDLWRTFGRERELHLENPEAKRSLQQLRQLENRRYPIPPPQTANVWRRGFAMLFGPDLFPDGWELKMAQAAARAIATGEKVVLLTRRMVGRNLNIRRAGHSDLHEITRWILYLHCEGMPPQHILCIYNSRNLVDDWTVRFDWRLPSNSGGVPFPFCPPDQWWKGAIQSFRTTAGKHAWIDKHDNGWARPNIPNGAGYHWDVYIASQAMRQAVGLDQINVVQFGGPMSEGLPGTIHHVPTVRAGRARQGACWTCG